MILILAGGSTGCINHNTRHVRLLKPGTRPFAVEWVWGLEHFDGHRRRGVQACHSLILAGWGYGEVNPVYIGKETVTPGKVPTNMRSNTTIICSRQISTGKFMVTVDGEGRVKQSKRIGQLKYHNPGIFTHSTSVGNFKAQPAIILHVPLMEGIDFGIMHNNTSHSFSQFSGEFLINNTPSDPSTRSPHFQDAQHAMSKFY